MNQPDFEHMTKDEVIAWFRSTKDLSPVLSSMQPASEHTGRSRPDVSMMLASIRLPIVLIEQLDHLAASQGVRRSDIIREALSTYVVDQTAPVEHDEAEHALDVLRRVVAHHRGYRAA